MTYLLARCTIAIMILAVLAIPARQATAQASPRYIAIDLGTFGGPNAALDLPGVPITSQGAVLGTADTTIPDTDYPNFNPFENIENAPDPYIEHAFSWQNGHLNDLGALPGNNNSAVFEVNGRGIGTGISETSTVDPTTGWPSMHAALFENGLVSDLGTLPGGDESVALAIDDAGGVAGFGTNGTADPYSMFGTPTEWRTFVWQNGVMRDIGDLGGPDAIFSAMNSSGAITGQSYTSTTPNADNGSQCAPNVPAQDPYLWQNGRMQDLGTLGGTCGYANWINGSGEVVGQSNVQGNQTFHPFLWNGRTMRDLGTLGGDTGAAYWINDTGQVVGHADLPGNQTHDGFLWQNGVMTPLPPVDGAPCSNTFAINDRGQAVGNVTDCHGHALAAVLWDHGTGYDLNAFVSPSAALHLTEAAYINDQGEIVADAVVTSRPDSGDQHIVLLTPATVDARAGVSTRAMSHLAPSAQSAASVTRSSPDPRDVAVSPRDRLAARYHVRLP